MRKVLIIGGLAVITLLGCARHVAPMAPVGMASPASVYCGQLGGKLQIVQAVGGETGWCTLPGGERVEEWVLFRRDHPDTKP